MSNFFAYHALSFKVLYTECLLMQSNKWKEVGWASVVLISLINNIKFLIQIESSSALGAINTPDYEKKIFAAQSLEYNLRDKLFCELFPDTVLVSC